MLKHMFDKNMIMFNIQYFESLGAFCDRSITDVCVCVYVAIDAEGTSTIR